MTGAGEPGVRTPVASRAATTAVKAPMLPPEVSTPPAAAPRPTASAIHRMTTCSRPAAPGLIDAWPEYRLEAAARKSAMAAEYRPPDGMYPKYRGDVVATPGDSTSRPTTSRTSAAW